MDAATLAQIIADYLIDRDDIAQSAADDGFVAVTTQGGINFLIEVKQV